MDAGSTATLEATEEAESLSASVTDGSDAAESRRSAGQPSTSGRQAPGQDFIDLGVDDRLTMRLKEMGVLQPTDVQREAIPKALTGTNVAIQCYTGSGKTLAYLLPVLTLALQKAEAEFEELAKVGKAHTAGTLQAIVVAPSRELAMQIMRVGQAILPNEAKGCVQQAIGGANPRRQAEALKLNKPLVVVGTPGRLAELSRLGTLQSHNTTILVLDEVDQLLAVQFREDMVRLIDHVGRKAPRRQTLLVSATLNEKVLEQCQRWCPDPERLFTSVGPQIQSAPASASSRAPEGSPAWGWDHLKFSGGDSLNPATRSSAGGLATAGTAPMMPPQLEHGWLAVDRRHRVDALRRVIHSLNAQRALVFMNFQHRLKDTVFKLSSHGMKCGELSGDMNKEQRQNTMRRFQQGEYRALIVSDVAARGLDIAECDAVINLELPSDASHYAHRAGRTGRAGRQGVVVTLVEQSEQFVIQKLSRGLGVTIPELQMREGMIAPVESSEWEEQGISKSTGQ
ncbi:g6836 [Coccomyxa viridis]|uniref:G6836 protein n=1 Tax=Coccomyxa viridis TaxID=1274662 RepID=A0ABP1FYW4_9CHLO